MGAPSLSFGTVAVLHAVAAGHRFGFDIVDATGLTAGSVYPALDRLEALGFLRSSWEAAALALAEALRKHRTFQPVPLETFGIRGPRPAPRRP